MSETDGVAVRLALALVAAVVLPGCTLVQEPEVREIVGPTDGYTPTPAFLKLSVKREDGTVAMLNFDRRDWYTSKIAEMVDGRDLSYVSAQAMPRNVLNEYVAQTVADPTSLAKLRYDEMHATGAERMRMDAEYTQLLERVLGPEAPPEAAPPLPVAGLPLAGSG